MKYIGLALIALFTTISTISWGAGPSVKLSPNTNHPQAADKVSGNGFDAYKAVDIYWDTTDILLATTGGNGSFGPLKFTVPQDALPGEHWISAIERGSGTAAQALFTVNTDWAQRGFVASGKRYNPWENVISPDNVDTLELAWTYTTGNIVESSPAVVNGIVYIGSNDYDMYALDATTGILKWVVGVDGPIDYSSPAVANGLVYVGTTNGTLYALNAATGATKWAHSTGYVIESSPTVADGMVYFGASDGYLYALNAATGNTVWTAPTTANAAIFSTPAIGKGNGTHDIVYIGSGDHKVYAFDAANGTVLWTLTTGNAVLAAPAISNGYVYIGSYDRNLLVIDAYNGNSSGIAFSGEIFASAAIARDVIYVADDSLGLTALRVYPPGGSYDRYWKFPNLGAIDSSPAVANGIVYFGTNGGGIAALSAGKQGGSNLWSSVTGGSVTSSPAVSNGMIYAGSADHNIYAYALNGGNNAAYKRSHTRSPAFARLHPDLRLKVSR